MQALATEERAGDCVGLELTDENALSTIESGLSRHGLDLHRLDQMELTRAGARMGAEFCDFSGNRVRLLVDPLQSGKPNFHGSSRWLTELADLGLRSTDIQRDLAVWTDVLGACLRDQVGDVSYLAVDGAHHRVALYPSTRAGILYTSFAVPDLDALMRNFYLLAENRIRILQGPGRETVSGNMFIRFAAPEGHVFALIEATVDDWQDHRARMLPFEPESFCSLGCSLQGIPEMMVKPENPE